MSDFPLHEPETAGPEARDALERAREAFGHAPNLLKVLAGSPAAAHGYLDLRERAARGLLGEEEREIVLLAASVENGCPYGVAAHTAGALRAGVDSPEVDAVRDGRPLDAVGHDALRRFTRVVVRGRGRVDETEMQRFLQSGFQTAHVLEVLLLVAMETLSNYTSHMADPPLDEALEEHRWTGERERNRREDPAADEPARL